MNMTIYDVGYISRIIFELKFVSYMLILSVFIVLTFLSKSSFEKVSNFELKYLDIHIYATFDNYYSPSMCLQVESRLM